MSERQLSERVVENYRERCGAMRGDEGRFGVNRAIGVSALVVGLLAGGAVVGADLMRTRLFSVEPNYEQAEAITATSVYEIDRTTKLQTVEMEFSQAMIIKDIRLEMNVLGIDWAAPDPDLTVIFSGKGFSQIEIPVSAIQQEVNPTTNKVDITIDTSKIEQTTAWHDGEDGKKTIVYIEQDREGSLVRGVAGLLGIGGNNAANAAIEKAENQVREFTRRKGKQDFLSSCGASLNSTGEETAIDGVRNFFEAIDDGEKLGTIKLSEPLKIEEFAEDDIELNAIKNEGELDRASVSCSIDAANLSDEESR